MKLTRLRLHGFKSFVEPTDFLIDPGLTGVVGPNGCGKSNLVEALRWVMGESSARGLRGDEMDDVIFSGSAGRAASGRRSVCASARRSILQTPICKRCVSVSWSCGGISAEGGRLAPSAACGEGWDGGIWDGQLPPP